MKYYYISFWVLLLCSTLSAQQFYLYEIDVNKIENDQIKVTLRCPKINQKQIHFYFPAYIPNNYAATNYGRFISKFSVKNAKGQYINFTQKDINSYLILNAQDIHSIEYTVDDTWDLLEDRNYVFGSSGTNIETDCILINAGGFFGYFENYQNIPFHIKIIHSNQWYAHSSLFIQERKESYTTFLSPNYNRLVDNPIIATTKRDTIVVKQDKIECLASVYAAYSYPKDSIRRIIKSSLSEIQSYLQYPINKQYHIILYLRKADPQNKQLRDIGAFGATEHTHCSVIHIPEDMDEYHPLKTPYLKRIQQLLCYNLIYAALNANLPSSYLVDFDFQKSVPTAHNWFYTSFPHYISLLIDNDDNLHRLCSWMSKKASLAKHYPEGVPLNSLSLHIADYPNPYDLFHYFFDYGVLLMFCLDVEIIFQTKGEKNLLQVIKSLNKKFDKERPFTEQELIPAIVEQSSPEIARFFEVYFQKYNKPDYAKYAQYVGLKYEEGIFIPLDTQTAQQKQYLKKWLQLP
ncbi:MAG: hypothetical protein NZ455_05515 [Bacteroidia bacterium]|nr:hypothetical protein [Bacteroidia bacterium]MDW8347952.1 hypothetical protein [Bacteroidia bacterium]